MLVTLSKIREVHFRLLGRNGFHVKAENERFIAALFSEPQKRKFHVVIWLRQKVAQGARLFFLVLPIKSLIFGVVVAVAVAVAVVISLTPLCLEDS